jgi:hypothetical protein
MGGLQEIVPEALINSSQMPQVDQFQPVWLQDHQGIGV